MISKTLHGHSSVEKTKQATTSCVTFYEHFIYCI